MVRQADATRAIALIPQRATIVAGPGCGTPTSLLAALAESAKPELGWELWSGLLLGELPFIEAVRKKQLGYRTWHVTRETQDLVSGGSAAFVPVRGADVPALLADRRVDVALVRVSPPDRHGFCSLGTSVSYPRPLIDIAAIVIGEVDEDMPRTEGRSRVHVSAFDALMPSTSPTPQYRTPPPGETSRRIAEHILPLLPRRAALQLGIGGVPEALTALLAEADLGPLRCIGMGNDAMVELFDRGVLERDRIVPHPAIAAVELMGTRVLLDFADGNPAIGVYPVGEAGDPRALGRIDRFVSINSALEVDLLGQVNAEWVGGRQVSGIGGSVDFVEAARASDGGLRVVAMPSTAGARSRIVPVLAPGAPVSVPRHALQLVVTEYGAADLRGLSTRERSEALIAIADPAHRADLESSIA
jgi:4-hydroxybutyrate CoA-transferase